MDSKDMAGEAAAEIAPSGTVTFLFSDIEGSTQRWETRREEMQSALRMHDELMRDVIERHSGYVFKTVGDAFCAAFSSVPKAILCALQAQCELAARDWNAVGGLRVRMAIHTGDSDERGGDYFGPAVNRVARLLAVGHGGQILVSGTAKELAEGAMPVQSALHDLGAHRLKDLTHPEQVYQLVAPDLPAEFPPLRSLESLPNNLPLQLTSFIGREADVAEIEELLAHHRLVTLLGSGGVGKTRLSLQVGANLLDRYPDGVWFIEFAPLSDPSAVIETIAAVFNVTMQSDRPVIDSLVACLRTKHALLIFDNCEHVVAQAARAADAILRGAPKVRILASSREALGVQGERALRVASLSLPPTEERLTAQSARSYGAIGLFCDRASAADRRFALTDENCETVAEICRQLDGIALAIELAAPRVKVLSVEQLASRLNQRFRLLTGGSRTALPRQQTMRALIDWSYDLLSETEKTVFRRISVFTGGFSLDAAGEICADDAIEPWDVLDLLSSLVDKSLVATDLAGSEQRYHLLVSMRQYAFERLDETPELLTIQRKHAEYFTKLALDAGERWAKVPTSQWIAPLDREFENFQTTLQWALHEQRDPKLGMDLISALKWYWRFARRSSEVLASMEAALAASANEPPSLARLGVRIALMDVFSGQSKYGAMAAATQDTLSDAEALGDQEGLGLALCLGAVASHTDPSYDAEAVLRRTRDIFESLGEKRYIALSLFLYSRWAFASGGGGANLSVAQELQHQALALARQTGYENLLASILNNLGEVRFWQNDVAGALRSARESKQYALKLHLFTLVASNFANIAAYLIAQGDYAAAVEAAKQGANLQAGLGPIGPVLGDHFAAIALHRSMPEVCAHFLGSALAGYELLGNHLEPTERQLRERTLGGLQGLIAPQVLADAIEVGRNWSDDQFMDAAQHL